jgi:hypothetical protein
MGRKIGLVLLGLLLFACFVPVYSMLVIFPTAFIFGDNATVFRVALAFTYALSAATSIWLIAKLWKPKASAPKEPPASRT